MKYIILLLLLTSNMYISAKTIKGHVMDEHMNSIIGASILIKGTSTGTITDTNGMFNLEINDTNTTLIVSAIGYTSDTISIDKQRNVHITLQTGVELEDALVTTSTPGSSYNRNSIGNIQDITIGELQKAACCNLSESFETNASVDVSYNDAATGAKQIKLLGLAGKYVQMQSENVPTLRGIATPYGLDYTPGTWLSGIQISKGAASVKNGYESMTGQINFEYLKPNNSDKIGINIYASDAGKIEGNLTTAIPINEKLHTGILAHIEKGYLEIDNNNDNFLDKPLISQQNIINNWQYTYKNYILHATLRALNEDRTGGQISSIPNPYTISIENKRYEAYTKHGFIFHDKNRSSMALITSGSFQQNNSLFGMKSYDGEQTNWYANLIYETEFSTKHKLSSGLSWNYDKFEEQISANPINTLESTPGLFLEYTYNYNDKLILLAGGRVDHSSLYGTFYTPRIHIKYNSSDYFSLRGSIGKGYRSPFVIAENSYLLASGRNINISSNLPQEEAWNYGITATSHIPINHRELTLQGEFFYTSFINQTISDLDSDPHAVNIINIPNGSYARSIQLEAKYEILQGWTLTAAHRITNTKATIKGKLRELPLTNRYKGLITTSYQTKLKKWQFDFTSQFNGGGRLPDPDVSIPKWDNTFDPYIIFNAQITKYFRHWSIYLGSENIGGFIQENPIIDAFNPTSSDFDATMIWGPIHGRKIYAGLRWNLPTTDKH